MKVYNFSPGPAILPDYVKDRLKESIDDFKGSGIGIAELSHRTPIFDDLILETENKILNICNLKKEDYKVLFLQGGASQQFAMMPMNFLRKGEKAAFVISGVWAKKAFENALYYGNAEVIAKTDDYKSVPIVNNEDLKDFSYLHLSSNNTIYGTSLSEIPNVNIPIFCDASSDFLSRKLDFSKVSFWYACAQKNLGIAGVTIVIVKKTLLNNLNSVPDIFSYKVHADKDSCFNTPCTIGILATSLTIDWINQSGGIEVIEKENTKKADLIYSVLDSYDCFIPFAEKESRSKMNITFNLKNNEIEEKLSASAKEKGFLFIDGHRSVGGFRISIYNAQSIEACREVAEFLSSFAENLV